MGYTVDIDRSVEALAYCLKQVNQIRDIEDWYVYVNAGGIDYGIYLNFNVERKELVICNQPARGYDDSYYLEEIIEMINENTEEEEFEDD